MRLPTTLALSACIVLAACSDAEPPPPPPQETAVPESLAAGAPAPQEIADNGIGTPLDERVATLGLLNKRNNISQDIEIAPGDSQRVGNVIIRLASCERTAPWENPPETGAFVQVFVEERTSAEDSELSWKKVFSGWLFKNNPSINVVEHPIYDVWVKDCAMSFPGEEEAATSSSDE